MVPGLSQRTSCRVKIPSHVFVCTHAIRGNCIMLRCQNSTALFSKHCTIGKYQCTCHITTLDRKFVLRCMAKVHGCHGMVYLRNSLEGIVGSPGRTRSRRGSIRSQDLNPRMVTYILHAWEAALRTLSQLQRGFRLTRSTHLAYCSFLNDLTCCTDASPASHYIRPLSSSVCRHSSGM